MMKGWLCKLLGHKMRRRQFSTPTDTYCVVRCTRGCGYVRTMCNPIPGLLHYYAPKAFDMLMQSHPLLKGYR